MAKFMEPARSFWGALTAPDRDRLREAGSRSTFAAGKTLLAQHDVSGDIAVVWSGFTKVVARGAAGRHVVLALRGPGDIVGELANLGGGPRSAAVVAIDEVTALLVARSAFAAFLSSSAHASEVLQRTVVDRLREADRDRLAVASMTVGQGLARLLLKLVQRYGVPNPSGGVTVDLLSQKELADCVGGARRSVTREMTLWRQRGIISTERRSVTVHNLGVLARIAGRNSPPP